MEALNQLNAATAHLEDSISALRDLPVDQILKAANLIIQTLKSGGKIMLCGNGGSAADAQHIAAELMGRYKVDRKPLAAIALTTDTSALTAIANDYSFEEVFSRQINGVGKAGDCLIAISTSGTSKNVWEAMVVARDNGIKIIGLTGQVGQEGWKSSRIFDVCINVPSTDTPIIQQCHITIGHIICTLVEAEFTK